MEILEAYDLTGSYRDAGELAGCSHHTVAGYVQAREEGRLSPGRAQRRPMLIDAFLPKLEEWVDRSKGKVRADVAHGKLVALGYTGSERTTRRAVAEARVAWRAGQRRVHRPWVPEPGMWFQYDFGTGPRIGGGATWLFCAWLAWCRFRVVLPILDKTLPTVMAAIDQTLRAFGGVPTYGLTDYVPRNIVGLLLPSRLCGRRCRESWTEETARRRRPHNDQSDDSQSSSVWSDLHIGRERDASEAPAGSVFRSASIFALVVISA